MIGTSEKWNVERKGRKCFDDSSTTKSRKWNKSTESKKVAPQETAIFFTFPLFSYLSISCSWYMHTMIFLIFNGRHFSINLNWNHWPWDEKERKHGTLFFFNKRLLDSLRSFLTVLHTGSKIPMGEKKTVSEAISYAVAIFLDNGSHRFLQTFPAIKKRSSCSR